MSTESIGFPDKQPSDIENGGKIEVHGFRMIVLVIFMVVLILVSTFLMNHFSTEDDSTLAKYNTNLSINNNDLLMSQHRNQNEVVYEKWCTKYDECFLILAKSSSEENIVIRGIPIRLPQSIEGGNENSIREGTVNRKNVRSILFENMNLSRIENNIFHGLVNLLNLKLENSTLEYIHLEDFQELLSMKYLSMRHNKLSLYTQTFPKLPSLSELYLDDNVITNITKHMFANLQEVRVISLTFNGINTIDEEAFQQLVELRALNLCHNKIVRLDPRTFINQKRLTQLCLGFNNPLMNIPAECFKYLVGLEYLNLEEVQIENINTSMFESLQNLKSVDFKYYYYCDYVQIQENCRPSSDGISSSTNLLAKPMFRYWNWIIAAVICTGNFLVIFSRLLCKDDNQMLSMVIRNLAVSDFLMGVYLLIIGTKDVKYRDRYSQVVQEWRTSWECTITGIVGMISCEVTVCSLVFISVDRFLMITSPLGKGTLQNKRNTFTVVGTIWSLGIIIAITPVLRYANDNRFYGVNGLCFPLHLGNPYFTGWQYSAVIIFGINATSLIIITVVYVAMFINIWRTRNATTLPRKEYEFVIRFFFIVFIYTICWLPIIVLKAMMFFKEEVPDELYGWLIVFVLPINSASNPILYTFTSPKFTAKIKKSFTADNYVPKNNEYTSPVVSPEGDDNLKSRNDESNQVKIMINRF